MEDFIAGAHRLLSDHAVNVHSRAAVCRDAHSLYTSSVSATAAVTEWAQLIVTASTPSATDARVPVLMTRNSGTGDDSDS